MSFQKDGYEVVRGFLDEQFCEFAQEYMYTKIRGGNADLGDGQAYKSFCLYGDPFFDTILALSVKHLSEVTGKRLAPQYTYTRLYQYGEELTKHRDREECEISATLTLGYPNKSEPIYFSREEDGSDAVPINLEVGDLCIYRGCELWHWRPQFESDWYLQVFLHLVDVDGPYKNQIYDYRQYLGMLANTRDPRYQRTIK